MRVCACVHVNACVCVCSVCKPTHPYCIVGLKAASLQLTSTLLSFPCVLHICPSLKLMTYLFHGQSCIFLVWLQIADCVIINENWDMCMEFILLLLGKDDPCHDLMVFSDWASILYRCLVFQEFLNGLIFKRSVHTCVCLNYIWYLSLYMHMPFNLHKYTNYYTHTCTQFTFHSWKPGHALEYWSEERPACKLQRTREEVWAQGSPVTQSILINV